MQIDVADAPKVSEEDWLFELVKTIMRGTWASASAVEIADAGCALETLETFQPWRKGRPHFVELRTAIEFNSQVVAEKMMLGTDWGEDW